MARRSEQDSGGAAAPRRGCLPCRLAALAVVAFAVSCASTSLYEDAAYGWRDMGTAAATLQEVEKIRRGAPDSLAGPLADLTRGQPSIRRRAANIFERLGTSAPSATSALVTAFEAERDPVCRAFIVRALAETRSRPETVSALRRAFRSGLHPVLRTYIAGAIIKLNGLGQSRVELQFLLDSLNPAGNVNEKATRPGRGIFWERRWTAAYMIAKLGPAGTPLVGALEACTDTPETPLWVKRQIYFSLRQVTAGD